MKIALVHNYYRQYGGEDAIFESECKLLKDFGSEIVIFTKNNKDIEQFSSKDRLNLLANWSWQKKSQKIFENWLDLHQPDIVHCHNIFYLITAGIHQACKKKNIPVIQNLNNFRLFCLNGLLYRDGKICEDCIGGHWKEGVKNKCFQNSAKASWLFSQQLKKSWDLQTWQQNVDAWVAPTRFTVDKYHEAGFNSDNFYIKPNVIYPMTNQDINFPRQNFALYVGRLSDEKGIMQLVTNWKQTDIPLKIIGKGPLENDIRSYVVQQKINNIEVLGFLPKEEVIACLKQAKALIISSECYENFPCVIIEAFATGLPVIAPDNGSFKEIIENEQNGLLFDPDNFSSLINCLEKIFNQQGFFEQLSQQCLNSYHANYSPEKCYERLIRIYETVVEQKAVGVS